MSLTKQAIRLSSTLNLSNTDISFIPESLKNLNFLEKLNLSNTYIDARSLKNLPQQHLSVLVLRNCKNLKKLFPSFKNYRQLECLDLSRSSIRSKSLENLPANLSALALNKCSNVRDLPPSMKKLEDIYILQLMIPKLSFESLDNIPTKRLERVAFHYDSTSYWAHHFEDAFSVMYYGLTKHWEESYLMDGKKRSFLEEMFDSPCASSRAEMFVRRKFNARVYFGDDNVLLHDNEIGAKYDDRTHGFL